MAIQHVKVNEVDEGEALKIAVGQLQRHPESLGIAGGADGFPNALACKNVVDLTHTDGLLSGSEDSVQHCIARRHQTVVMAARRAGKVGGAVPHKRSGNDAADAVLPGEQLPRLGTDLIELFHRDKGFVRSDLEHAVGGGVNDERPGPEMLLAVVADDIGAGIGLVAEDLIPGFGRECIK